MKLNELILKDNNIDIDEYLCFIDYVKSTMEHPEWLGDFTKTDIKQILKSDGKIIFDIFRFDKLGNKIIFPDECNYPGNEIINVLNHKLSNIFNDINIEVASFKEDNLEDNSSYQSIEGKFLVISGTKK